MVAPSSLVQLGDLDAHLHAQRGVEVGQRLVEQEDLGIAHDGAADGDALALAAGQLPWACARAGVDLQDLRARPRHRAVDLGRGTLASFRPKAMFSYTVMCG
jgi:hypothetical protein